MGTSHPTHEIVSTFRK